MILHGLSCGTRPFDRIFIPDLISLLCAKDYVVDVPALPETYFQQLQLVHLLNRMSYLDSAYGLAGLDTIVGHSYGGGLALIIAQYFKVRRLVLLAPFFHENILEMLNVTSIAKRVKQIVIVYEPNDPLIPEEDILQLYNKLTLAQIKVELKSLDSEDHLCNLSQEKLGQILSQ